MPKKKKETASKTTLTPSLVAAIQLLVQQSTVPADDASPPPAEGLPDALDEAAPVPVASDADVEAALRAVADHAAAAEVHRHDLAKANAIAPVVTICTRATTTEHRNQAARALRMLAFNNPIVYGGATAYKPEFVAFDNAAAIVKAGGLEVLAVCLREGATLAQQEHAAAALGTIATTSDRRAAIARAGVLAPLVARIKRYAAAVGAPADAEEALAASEHMAVVRQVLQALGSIVFNHEANQAEVHALLEARPADQAALERIAQDAPSLGLRKAAEYAMASMVTARSDGAPSA